VRRLEMAYTLETGVTVLRREGDIQITVAT
jgi:hypothetical protein